MRIGSVLQLIVLIATLFTLAPDRARADTLADVLVAAYRHSNLLDQYRAVLRATDEGVAQARALLLPVVEFTANARAEARRIGNQDPTSSLQLGFSLNARMTLYDFGRGELGIQGAREQVLAVRAGLVAVEQTVLLRAVQTYLNVISARDTVTLRRSNVDLIGQELRAARERFELGDSTRTDVAIAEARLAAAQSALAAAEGNFNVSREEFNLAVGRYPNALVAAPRLPRLPASLDAALETGRRNHPSILQAQHQVTIADLQVQIAHLERMGTVSGSLGANVTGSSVISRDVTGGISWNVPIYSGGRQASGERRAIAGQDEQRAGLHITVAQVHQAIAANWAQLAVARAQLAASETQISAARTAYDSVRAEAEFGSRTTLDVLNAEQELLDAQSNRIFSSASVQLASYALLESMGQLTVTALNLGIPTYDVEAYSNSIGTSRRVVTPSSQGQSLDRIMGRFTRP